MSDLSNLTNRYIALRNERLEIERTAQKIKEQEDEIKLALIAAMRHAGALQFRSTNGLVTHSVKQMPTVKDWQALYEYIAANNAFDLLQRRLHEGAVAQRTEDRIAIPGVTFFPVDKITVSG